MLAISCQNFSLDQCFFHQLQFCHTSQKMWRRRRYCKNLDIKLVFAPYKIKNLFSAKDAISKLSRSRVVYKCSCAGCGACYVGETNRHLATRVREHFTSDKNSISFSTLMGQKHADLYARRIVFQSLTPPPHLSN